MNMTLRTLAAGTRVRARCLKSFPEGATTANVTEPSRRSEYLIARAPPGRHADAPTIGSASTGRATAIGAAATGDAQPMRSAAVNPTPTARFIRVLARTSTAFSVVEKLRPAQHLCHRP